AQDAGRVFFYSGATGALVRTATHTIASQRIGLTCRGIGDQDGDGRADFLVAGTGGGTSGPPVGRLFVLKGATDFDRFCSANANSTGAPAYLTATGAPSLAANDLSFTASPVPENTFAILFFGDGIAQVPLGNGVRCVGGGVIRRLVAERATGSVWRYDLDATAPPAGGLFAPGSQWHFQAWYRDPLGGGSGLNLSDGVSVTFAP
ncbi:MAG: hypothetical protein AAF726_24685, partial [Planctomycetota bacterium]